MGNEGQTPSNPFEHLDVPRKGELTVSEINSRIQAKIRQYLEDPESGSWSYIDIRDDLTKEAYYGDLSIRGQIQIAQGEQSILALNYEQTQATKIIFGLPSPIGDKVPTYASVQGTGRENPQTEEAVVKIVSGLKPSTDNHLIISKGLARRLDVTNQNEVRITSIFQKPEDINLDKI